MEKVYLINADTTDKYKIGYTKDVKSRIKSLQTGCPYKLKLIKEVLGDSEQEKVFHKTWKSHRKRGEWFEFKKEELEDVCRMMENRKKALAQKNYYIVEILSTYVKLKQRGRNFWGVCPFHIERNPFVLRGIKNGIGEFAVSPDNQNYKCFKCGAEGGVIDFLIKFIKKIENKKQRSENEQNNTKHIHETL